jgi:hypothetical protein
MGEKVSMMIKAFGGILDMPNVRRFSFIIEVDDAKTNGWRPRVYAKELSSVFWCRPNWSPSHRRYPRISVDTSVFPFREIR